MDGLGSRRRRRAPSRTSSSTSSASPGRSSSRRSGTRPTPPRAGRRARARRPRRSRTRSSPLTTSAAADRDRVRAVVVDRRERDLQREASRRRRRRPRSGRSCPPVTPRADARALPAGAAGDRAATRPPASARRARAPRVEREPRRRRCWPGRSRSRPRPSAAASTRTRPSAWRPSPRAPARRARRAARSVVPVRESSSPDERLARPRRGRWPAGTQSVNVALGAVLAVDRDQVRRAGLRGERDAAAAVAAARGVVGGRRRGSRAAAGVDREQRVERRWRRCRARTGRLRGASSGTRPTGRRATPACCGLAVLGAWPPSSSPYRRRRRRDRRASAVVVGRGDRERQRERARAAGPVAVDGDVALPVDARAASARGSRSPPIARVVAVPTSSSASAPCRV